MSAQAELDYEIKEQDPGLSYLLADWANAAGDRLKAGANLVLAETRLAVSTFLLMVLVVMMAGGAFLFAWGLLILAMIEALSLAGLPLLAGIGVLFLIHLALAFGLLRFANSLGRHMEFTATRRLLGPKP
ncbi:MAG: hypothetical protein WBS20_15605 [Lysobacterales bacterium]